MKFLKDVWDGLAYIGLVTVLYGCYFAWCQLKRANTSAKKSQAVHQDLVEVKAVEDRDDLGVEAAPWPSSANHPQK